MKLLIALLIALPAQASVYKAFKGLCVKHLIADDPYQYEGVKYETLEDLVNTHNDKVAWIELRARLSDPDISPEEKAEINAFFEKMADKD